MKLRHKTTAVAVVIAVFLGLLDASAEEPFFDSRDIFIGGLDGYDTFRIPAVVVCNSGAVLAFCEGRKTGPSDTGNIDLLLKRSFDNGDVWQPLQVVWDDGPNTCGNPCPVVDRVTGTVWLLVTHNLGKDRESAIWDGTSEGSRTVRALKSDDDGATWSEPREITETTKQADWTWYATGPGVGIQLSGGRLVIPCDHGVAVTRDYHSHVIYSDDHGKTWWLGGTVPDNTTSECQVVERSDGALLINIRNHPAKTGFRTVAVSRDGGLGWSETSLDTALVDPGCQGSILRYSGGTGGGKNRILFSDPADSKDRVNMTVRLSYDDGASWRAGKTLHGGPSAYSCLGVLADRRIACFYECGDIWRYEKITFARFNLEWLTGGADTADAR